MRLPIARLALCVLFPVLAAAADSLVLTPKPAPAPSINGPSVYGVRPGRPFLYRIPATGERPMRFAAEGLPAPLILDAATGIVTGITPRRKAEYGVTLRARNTHGEAVKRFRIVVGGALALTPPMGWNDWYTHYDHVTDVLVRRAASAMVASGMADFGYQYVNIDDCWMVKPGDANPEVGGEPRDAAGNIRPNRRFPDMKALTDFIHTQGLKAGIYTSPGPLTCARFTGSYNHEEADARQFAAWGFDFLKYDWCSYERVAPGKTLADRKRPYEQMGAILAGIDRDMVFNLCQYGMNDVWTWGRKVGGNCWRTTGDLGLEKGSRLPGFYAIAFQNAARAQYAGPGHWNDPDYILIGSVGNARNISALPKPTSLTPDEQYSYMSLWSLMAAPLFFSGHMEYLDEFTLNVLCNAEVIEVDQDALGRQARLVRRSDDEFVLAKSMEDGSLAVGLFNLGEGAKSISATWTELGIRGGRHARDLWRQKEIGRVTGQFSADVPSHGVALVRLSPR